MSLWIYALMWLRDIKSNVSTPFNVHRVTWLNTDLQWGGDNIMAQFGICGDRGTGKQQLEKLGGGGMANVYKVQHRSTGGLFALKVFHHFPQVILHEIAIMRAVRHPNCIQYYGCIPRGKELYLIMEYGRFITRALATGVSEWSR